MAPPSMGVVRNTLLQPQMIVIILSTVLVTAGLITAILGGLRNQKAYFLLPTWHQQQCEVVTSVIQYGSTVTTRSHNVENTYSYYRAVFGVVYNDTVAQLNAQVNSSDSETQNSTLFAAVVNTIGFTTQPGPSNDVDKHPKFGVYPCQVPKSPITFLSATSKVTNLKDFIILDYGSARVKQVKQTYLGTVIGGCSMAAVGLAVFFFWHFFGHRFIPAPSNVGTTNTTPETPATAATTTTGTTGYTSNNDINKPPNNNPNNPYNPTPNPDTGSNFNNYNSGNQAATAPVYY